MKKLFILSFFLLLLSCTEEEYSPIVQIEDKVEQFYKLVKVNSKTILELESSSYDRIDRKVTYDCSGGELVSDKSSLLFVAPNRPGKIKIKRSVENEEDSPEKTEYNILVYKQFVILKADDLLYVPGDIISDRWTSYFEYIRNKKIKSSVGIVGVSLKQGNSEYLTRVKDLHVSPYFEIWNHGYMHVVNAKDEEGNVYSEYKNTTYEYQKEMFEHSQDVVREKLGFKIRTFGAPGNAIDNITTRVVNEDDEIIVWFYGNENSTKYLIPRLHDIEFPYGVPDYDKFVNGYNPDEKCYSLQVHPNMWDSGEFKEFKKIIDFLIEQDVIFVNPYEYYKYSSKMI